MTTPAHPPSPGDLHLDGFIQSHPDCNSAFKITELTREQFTARFQDGNGWDEDKLKQVYQAAWQRQQQALLAWANVKDAVASPYYRGVLFNNVPQAFVEHQQSLPAYDRLFGSLDFEDCEHCRSIFGPAAYFVDLMRFVERHIPGSGETTLKSRRPDLFELRLNCQNTHQLIPYVDLVIEVLEATIRGANPDLDVYAALAAEIYPQSLPFHLYLEQTRAYLAQLKTSLVEIYETFGVDEVHVAREILALSPLEAELVATPRILRIDLPALAASFGFGESERNAPGFDLVDALSDVAVFLERTGLSRPRLDELLYQDLTPGERNAGLDRLFFYNNAGDGLGPLRAVDVAGGGERLENLSIAKLDRVHRFLRLARKLGWKFADLDLALRSLGARSVIEESLFFNGTHHYIHCTTGKQVNEDAAGQKTEVPLVLDSFTIEAWVRPEKRGSGLKGPGPLLCRARGTSVTDLVPEFACGIDEGGKLYFSYGSSGAMTHTSVHAVEVGVFTHVAVAVSRENGQQRVSFYVDGRLESDSFSTELMAPSVGTWLYIGRDFATEGSYFRGVLKDLRIWSEVRSAELVAGHRHRRLTGAERNLAAYWPLTRELVDELDDLTANRNHGLPGGNLALAHPEWRGAELVLDPMPERVPVKAFQFNGTDHQLSYAPFAGAVARTIEAWIEPRQRGDFAVLFKGDARAGKVDYSLGLDADGKVVFEHRYLAGVYKSTGAVPLERPSHICAVLAETGGGKASVILSINGVVDVRAEDVALVSPLPGPHGGDLLVGAGAGGRHFDGFLSEIRLWDRPRTDEQLRWSIHRALSPNEVGLIGYWPLHGVTPGERKTADLSPYGRHLGLSDLAMENMPPPVSSDLFVQTLPLDALAWLPVDATGAREADLGFYLRQVPPGTRRIGATAEHRVFDAGTDPVTVSYGDGAGLGEDSYETLVAELWFRTADVALASKQVLVAQGGAGDGLVVYLDGGRLYVVVWYQDAIHRLVQQTSSIPLAAPRAQNQAPPEPEGWHYFRLVHDNRRAINEVKATLDGVTLDVGEYFSFTPRGSFHFGGIPTGVATRFHDGLWTASGNRQVNLHGSVAEVLFWKTLPPDPEKPPKKHLLLSFPTAPVGGSGVPALSCGQGPVLGIWEPEDPGRRASCLELFFSPRELPGNAEDGGFFTPQDQVLLTRDDFYLDAALGLCAWLRGGELWLSLSQRKEGEETGPLLTWRSPLLEPAGGSRWPAPRKWHHLAVNIDYGVPLGRLSVAAFLNGEPLVYHDHTVDHPGVAALGGSGRSWTRGLVMITVGDKSHALLPCLPDGRSTGALGPFQGEVAELRLWSHARSQDEVVNNARITLEGSPAPPDVLLTLRQPGNAEAGHVAPGYRVAVETAWEETLTYPLLTERPIAARAFRFGGSKQFLFASALEDMDPADAAALRGNGPPAFTVEGWVKTEGGPRRHELMTKGNAGAGLTDFGLFIDESGHPGLSHVVLNGEKEAETREVVADGVVPAGRFTHVAAAVAGAEVRFFLNGEPAGTRALPRMTSDGCDLLVGTDFEHDGFFKGLAQEIRVWHRALGADEILANLFRRPEGAPELAARWPLADAGGETAVDLGPGGNTLHLGGATRFLGLGGAFTRALDFFGPDRRAAAFSGEASSALQMPLELPFAHDSTLEVWFKAGNPWVHDRKQVLAFQTGGDVSLITYLYDGTLYFGGMSGSEAGWLSHASVDAGRWSHAAVVWTREDRCLRGFVDGHLVGGVKIGSAPVGTFPFGTFPSGTGPFEIEPAAQSLSVGGTDEAAVPRFHDGEAAGRHFFAGQILEARLWLRALGQLELRSNRYCEVDDVADRTGLVLWWDFSRADDGFVLDSSGSRRHGPEIALSRLLPLGNPPPAPAQPVAGLDWNALVELAAIKRLAEDHRRPLDELCALWHEPRHGGRAEGPPLFDRVWNSTGRAADRWDFHRVRPLVWDVEGRRSPRSDREVENRLTGALRVSRQELRALVAHLSGGETVVLLTTEYFVRLQRLASLASLLRLKVEELLVLLRIAGQPVETLRPSGVRALAELAGWTREAGLSVARLDYVLHGVVSREAGPGYTETDVRALAAVLVKQPLALTAAEAEPLAEARRAILFEALAGLVGAAPEWLLAVAPALGLPKVETFYAWAAVVTEESLPAPLTRECERIGRAFLLHGLFGFDPATTAALLDGSLSVHLADLMALELAGLRELAALRTLRASIDDPEGRLTGLLRPGNASAVEQIAGLAGWEVSAARVQAGLLALAPPLLPSGLARLEKRFALAGRLHTDTAFLSELADVGSLDASFYRRQSEAVYAVLRARYTDAQWESVGRAIHDALAVRQRDALATFVMFHQVPASHRRKDSSDLLTWWLLLDVGMGSETDTARITQAIASVQVYVQRCLMNLEQGVKPEQIPQEHWQWMKNYRVWEANRKVFLYPENYIEPELRDTKSPLFAELEDELLQQNLNLESAATVYKQYLDRFIEVTNLKIVGSYVHDFGGGRKTLYLVGRSEVEPYVYYCREYDQVAWTAWRKIDIPIHSDHVSPVFAFGRLYVFWVETPEREKSRDRHARPGESLTNHETLEPHTNIVYDSRYDLPKQENYKVYTPEIKYSHLNFNGDWIQPQSFRTLPEINDAQHRETRWRRVYTQRSADFSLARSSVSGTASTPQPVKVWQLARLGQGYNSRRFSLRSFDPDHLTLSVWFKATNPGQRPSLPARTVKLCSHPASPGPLELRLSNLAGVQTAAYASSEAAVEAARAAMAEAEANQQGKIDEARTSAGAAKPALAALTRPTTPNIGLELDRAGIALQDAQEALDRAAPGGDFTPISGSLNQAKTELATAAARLNQTAHAATLTALGQIDAKLATAAGAVTAAEGIDAVARRQAWGARKKDLADLEPRRYESAGLQVCAALGSATTAEVAVEYDTWQHLSLTLDYNAGKYSYELRVLTQSRSKPATVPRGDFPAGPVLPNGEQMALGQPADPDAGLPFPLQMAELCLLQIKRTPTQISDDRGNRLRGDEDGLVLHQPLADGAGNGDLLLVLPKAEIVFEDKPIERVLLFYGDTIHAMLLNGADRSIDLFFEKPADGPQVFDLELYAKGLYMPKRPHTEMSIFDFAAPRYNAEERNKLDQMLPVISLFVSSPFHKDFKDALDSYIKIHFPNAGADRALIDEFVRTSFPEYFKGLVQRSYGSDEGLLNKLRKQQGTLNDVTNQPGWYVLDTGDEQYLVTWMSTADNSRPLPIKTVSESLTLSYQAPDEENDAQPININVDLDPQLRTAPQGLIFQRLNTSAVHELSLRLSEGGLSRMLSLESQRVTEHDFHSYDPHPGLVMGPPSRGSAEKPLYPIDFDGAYGLYYWEIFFHIPFLVANQLNANQRFAEAQQWYHYIFNPMAQENTDPAHPADRYWRFLPFRELTPQRISEMLGNEAALQRYEDDPFDPHAIAALRIGAYQKAVVMKYVDNLLDWADHEFTQDTRESINQATQVYLLACALLGPRPQPRQPKEPPVEGCFSLIQAELEKGYKVPVFPIGAESATSNGNGAWLKGPVYNPNIHMIFSFGVRENEKLIGYWDRVEDRLYKIRHSLNIEGVFRKLALFEPPIDPAALVRAAAAGGLAAAAASAGRVQVPHYRFDYVLEKARNMVNQTISLGGTLLSVLEKRDAEALESLRNTHERQILDMMVASKQDELEQAKINVAARRVSLESAKSRQDHYAGLIKVGHSHLERKQLELQLKSKSLHLVSGVLKVASGIAALVPEFQGGGSGVGGSPVATAEQGGSKLGKCLEAAAGGVETYGNFVAASGEIAGMHASYERREQDWELQEGMASFDVQQMEQEIAAAEVAVRLAGREIEIHEKNRRQNQEIAEFHERKFTSKALYNWMVSQVSALYFQSYKMAFDLAKSAEAAFNYELATDYTFIHHGHWDSLRKGLLAGEALMLELNRMEKAALEVNSRLLEIQRTFSLLAIDPEALWKLKQHGKCEIHLSERVFDQDYPGHYCRQIKSISVSVPAVVGPYQGIKATLTQLDNKVLLTPDTGGVDFLLGTGGSSPDASVLRADLRARQRVALSRGVDDAGMFQLNFADERYLPFEGTGAVSRWKLEMPKGSNRFDFDSITDVLLHLSYTAKADDGAFRDHVRSAVEDFRGYRVIALAQEQPAAWHAFKSRGQGTPALRFTPGHFFAPGVASPKVVSLAAMVESGGSGRFDLDVNGGEVTFDALEPGLPKARPAGPAPDQEWTLGLTKGDVGQLDDVLLLLAYEGKLQW